MKVAVVSSCVVALLALCLPEGARGACVPAAGQDGPAMLDAKLEYRMRVARADAEHEKLHDAADEIASLCESLSERVKRGELLTASDAKLLDRVKRLARKIRSDLGGGGEVVLEEKPTSVRDAVLALGARGAEFADVFSRSSRFVVDARVITLAGEILVLVDILKPHAR